MGNVKVGLGQQQCRRSIAREKAGSVTKSLANAQRASQSQSKGLPSGNGSKSSFNGSQRKRAVVQKKLSVNGVLSTRQASENSELENLLLEIITGPVEKVSTWLEELSQEKTAAIQQHVKDILKRKDGRGTFMHLQKVLDARSDLQESDLAKAHRTALQILATVRTGILGYLQDEVDIPSQCLAQIILQKRCRNVACLSELPADSCTCHRCKMHGFCNMCMCVACSKFDFDSNTCRWIGCDYCCHWCHTECALKGRMIRPWGEAGAGKGKGRHLQEFKCPACNQNSELYGFVKDVFQVCASAWQSDVIRLELDYVRRMFEKCQEPRGQKLHKKVVKLLDGLSPGGPLADMHAKLGTLFNESDSISFSSKSPSPGVKVEAHDGKYDDDVGPPKKLKRVLDAKASWQLVGSAFSKVEADAKATSIDLKRARLHYEMCANDCEERTREARALESERNAKRQQMEQLETIVKLKLSEADMFQLRAEAARSEMTELERIAVAKTQRIEGEYSVRYSRLKLEEAQAKREALCKIIERLEQEVEQAIKKREEILPEAIRMGVWPLPSRDNPFPNSHQVS
ncbi:hypothetical protein CBR_g20305 [Chara braunii]|uniref:OBERON-like protein n=1 Tax=Chara braunii TaxID=69332 RepID=A0A388L081_CHABU|nr:hypothetical protein CBR_g20305 [Chara braunii]|eukprot:GBG75678.1 hypothetical protein CBR_g20305 [Chara braunii]